MRNGGAKRATTDRVGRTCQCEERKRSARDEAIRNQSSGIFDSHEGRQNHIVMAGLGEEERKGAKDEK